MSATVMPAPSKSSSVGFVRGFCISMTVVKSSSVIWLRLIRSMGTRVWEDTIRSMRPSLSSSKVKKPTRLVLACRNANCSARAVFPSELYPPSTTMSPGAAWTRSSRASMPQGR